MVCFTRHRCLSTLHHISIWQLDEVRHPGLSNVRASLLLRVLVVDVVPFRELLTETFSTLSTWESRSV